MPLAVTLAAQLATLPWALAAFGRLSPVSPLANLVAVPWSGVALVVALAWAVLRLAIGAGADVLLAALDLLARPLVWLERLPASPWITFPLQVPWWGAWSLALLLASCVLLPRPRWSAWPCRAAVGVLWRSLDDAARTPELAMIDVAKGAIM